MPPKSIFVEGDRNRVVGGPQHCWVVFFQPSTFSSMCCRSKRSAAEPNVAVKVLQCFFFLKVQAHGARVVAACEVSFAVVCV